MNITPYLRSLYWFPLEDLSLSHVKQHFTVVIGDSDVPEENTTYHVYRVKIMGGRQWIGLPRGRKDLVKDCLKNPKRMKQVQDFRTKKPVDIPIRFQGKYHKYQLEAVQKLSNYTNGVLKSLPRTGKTIMGIGTIIVQGQKTLILAHQRDLIEQFCNETINNKDYELFNGLDYPELTGICRTYEEFQKYNICLATYQTFISKQGQHLLKRIKDSFGLVLIDEVHRAPADRYFQVLSKFSAKYIYGLTATDDRKDGKYQLADLLIGPVRHTTDKAKTLKPKVYGHVTPVRPISRTPKTWVAKVNHLFRHGARNDMIAQQAARDVRDGHIVLIPIIRLEHADTLTTLINRACGRDVCFSFTGRIPKQFRQAARNTMNDDPKIKVCIAMRPMLTGINIPRWSAIYTIAPISNVPTYTQEVFRICTVMEGKKKPIVRYFFDKSLGWTYGCLNTCLKTFEDPKRPFKLDDSFVNLLSSKQQTHRHNTVEGENLIKTRSKLPPSLREKITF